MACPVKTQLKPARFDEAMRSKMQKESLDAFLEGRVKRVLAGEADTLEPIHYDSNRERTTHHHL